MNKKDLVAKIAKDLDVTLRDATKMLDSFCDAVGETTKTGESVALVGFGTFSLTERSARKGRNPQTGEEITIAASKSVSFKAGKALKDAVS
ncbi:HU family DNA-binding protein [Alteromonas stellipolaris]|uniref:HU family DNA-binding protein n=1 Tax=Alteromonas stellipolaris TaxID=233316 RepID=UPI001D31F96B|nr:HU family DNA-binding protein [Alteromonas stellipolaris]MBZ2164267.1 HU family DNA-binding protein [Alteromonas stellipolaris]